MEEEKKVEELYSALKNASYAFCFNAAGDAYFPRSAPCPYAWADEDGIPECMMKPDFDNHFDCCGRKFIEVLKRYRKR